MKYKKITLNNTTIRSINIILLPEVYLILNQTAKHKKMSIDDICSIIISEYIHEHINEIDIDILPNIDSDGKKIFKE